MRQAAAAVSVRTYWACEPTATLRSAGAVCSAPREGGEGQGHIVAAARLQLVLANMTVKLFTRTLTLHKVVRQQI